MNLLIALIVILLLFGGISAPEFGYWHHGYGWGPSGGAGVLLIIVLLFLFLR